MLNQLRRKVLVKNGIIAVLLTIAAAACLVFADFSPTKLFAAPQQLIDVPVDELEGAYVEMDLSMVIDYFCYVEEYKNDVSMGITEKSYIIPVGENEFMGVHVNKNRMREMDTLLDSTTAVLDGTADELGEPVYIKGKISRMSDEDLGFYYEYLEYAEVPRDQQDYFLPLVINEGTNNMNYPLVVVAVLLLLFAVYLVVKAAVGGYQRGLTKMFAASQYPDEMRTQIERFYEENPGVRGVRADKEWVMYQLGSTTKLLKASEIAWMYLNVNRTRVNGIAIKSHSLAVRLRTGEKQEIRAKNAKQAQEINEYLFDRLPETLFGYTPALEEQFKQNAESFKDLAHQQHSTYQDAPDVTEPAANYTEMK